MTQVKLLTNATSTHGKKDLAALLNYISFMATLGAGMHYFCYKFLLRKTKVMLKKKLTGALP